MEQTTNDQMALLTDNTLCVGCRGCQVACKQWHNLPAEKTRFFGGPGYQNPPKLSSNTFTLIHYHEDVEDDQLKAFAFYKEQCRHCIEPACVSACLVKALEKLPNGPVVYHDKLCMGCRYCMIACPFEIPKFQYEKTIPLIQKCDMCYDRIEEGKIPACAQTCPSGAILFGKREDIIREAKKRIFEHPEKYVDHVYGETEVGGTNVMCISSTPLEKFGIRTDLGTEPIPNHTKPFLSAVPVVIIAGATVCTAFHWIVTRKNELARAEKLPSEKLED